MDFCWEFGGREGEDCDVGDEWERKKEDLCDLYCRCEGTLIGLIENSMDVSFYAFCYTYDAAIPYLQQTFTLWLRHDVFRCFDPCIPQIILPTVSCSSSAFRGLVPKYASVVGDL